MGGLEIVTGDMSELKTFVGSCVAICLFDIEVKIAAMAHVVLPKKTNCKPHTVEEERGKYADDAFAHMMSGMIKLGANPKRIQAKMAGGAAIFSHESETGLFNVGPRNISAIQQILKENDIPLISKDTGANFGRWVKFSLNSGKMIITSNLKKTEKII
ncbi:MAG: chemotaxis protein CheD [Thaumarchaeota archaeon]|nr:chemotaxis protein CheD [Nitrososphaerota archaeon]